MKKFILIFCVFSTLFLGFSNCMHDKVPPRIKLYNAEGKIIDRVTQYDGYHLYDTVITLFSQYDDPGVFVEDNKTLTENIVVTSNIEDVIAKYVENNHYVKKAGPIVINYTATDEEGNEAHISRHIRVANPAEIVAPYNPTTEALYGTTTFKLVSRKNIDGTNLLWDESLKNQTVTFTCDQNIPGAIRINKAFIHKKEKSSEIISFGGLVVELYSESLELSQTPSNFVGYLGTKKDINLPFYDRINFKQGTPDLTYPEIVKMLNNPEEPKRIQYLKIKENYEITYNGEKIVTIMECQTVKKNCSLTYLGTEVIGITLNYRIIYPGSIDNSLSPTKAFEVTEVYEKQYLEE